MNGFGKLVRAFWIAQHHIWLAACLKCTTNDQVTLGNEHSLSENALALGNRC
jgi:hypothetical protein